MAVRTEYGENGLDAVFIANRHIFYSLFVEKTGCRAGILMVIQLVDLLCRRLKLSIWHHRKQNQQNYNRRNEMSS